MLPATATAKTPGLVADGEAEDPHAPGRAPVRSCIRPTPCRPYPGRQAVSPADHPSLPAATADRTRISECVRRHRQAPRRHGDLSLRRSPGDPVRHVRTRGARRRPRAAGRTRPPCAPAGPPATSPPTSCCASATRWRPPASWSGRWPADRRRQTSPGATRLRRTGPRPAQPAGLEPDQQPGHRRDVSTCWRCTSTTRTCGGPSRAGGPRALDPGLTEALWSRPADGAARPAPVPRRRSPSSRRATARRRPAAGGPEVPVRGKPGDCDVPLAAGRPSRTSR